MVFGALIGALFWNTVTWYYGIPSSSSHALAGGIIGAAVTKAGASAIISSGIMKIVAFIFVSPILGFVLGSLLMVAVAWICRKTAPSKVDRVFRRYSWSLQPHLAWVMVETMRKKPLESSGCY